MTDWHKEIGKRLISIEKDIQVLRSLIRKTFDSLEENRDTVNILIERHNTLFEVFPYLRADINEIKDCLMQMLTLYKEMQTGIDENAVMYG